MKIVITRDEANEILTKHLTETYNGLLSDDNEIVKVENIENSYGAIELIIGKKEK